MSIKLTYREQVRYTLLNKNLGSVKLGWEDSEEDGVLNWDTSEEVFERDKKYDGVFLNLKANVEFVGKGADFINEVYDLGIKEKLQLVKERKHPNTDLWINVYSGFLDLKTRVIDKGIVSIKFNNSSLQQLLKSRLSEKVEIDRLDDLDGNVIETLREDTILLDGREINLVSKSEFPENENLYVLSGSTQGLNQPEHRSIKTNVITHEDPLFKEVTETDFIYSFNPLPLLVGTTNNMFYINNTGEPVTIDFHVTLFASLKFTEGNQDENIIRNFYYRLLKFKNGVSYNDPEHIMYLDQWTFTFAPNQVVTHDFVINQDITQTLQDGESLCICQRHVRSQSLFFRSLTQEELQPIIFDIRIDKITNFDPTTAKFIKSHNLFKRLAKIVLGSEDKFKSNALSTGIAKDTGNIHGFAVRGFSKEPQNDDNRYKPLTTSLKDQIQTHFALWNLGLGIETDGFNEVLIMEQRKHFYNLDTTVVLKDLINFDDIKISVAEKYFYSGVEVGFEKGGEYEEVNGLDEPNTKTTLTTTIDVLEKSYKAISKSSADSNRLELARRKQFVENSTVDTPFDNQIMLLDTIPDGSNFRQAKWQDHYETAPTGIFSPDTATELRFSPMQMMLRHSWFFNAGLLKYPNDYIRYASSVANSKMTTRLIGGVDVVEDGNIVNSELEDARFVPELWEFDYNVDFEIMEQIKGVTVINGVTIQNKNGLMEIPTTKGKFYGFIDLVSETKNKIKILKANR